MLKLKYPMIWFKALLLTWRSGASRFHLLCRKTTSHYLSQHWPRSMSPYCVTRPQRIKERSLGPNYRAQKVSLSVCLTVWLSDWLTDLFVGFNIVFNTRRPSTHPPTPKKHSRANTSLHEGSKITKLNPNTETKPHVAIICQPEEIE